MADPWERQEDETERQWAAFVVYRDLPPAERSLDAAGERIHGTHTGRKRGATGRVREWADAWRWVERAAAWDAEVDRRSREAFVEEMADVRRRAARGGAKAFELFERWLETADATELTAWHAMRLGVEGVRMMTLALTGRDTGDVDSTAPWSEEEEIAWLTRKRDELAERRVQRDSQTDEPETRVS